MVNFKSFNCFSFKAFFFVNVQWTFEQVHREHLHVTRYSLWWMFVPQRGRVEVVSRALTSFYSSLFFSLLSHCFQRVDKAIISQYTYFYAICSSLTVWHRDCNCCRSSPLTIFYLLRCVIIWSAVAIDLLSIHIWFGQSERTRPLSAATSIRCFRTTKTSSTREPIRDVEANE